MTQPTPTIPDAPEASVAPADSPVAPATSRAPDRRERLALVLLLLLALGVILATYRDYGITWDEHAQAKYGELCIDYFRSGGDDLSALKYLNLMYYQPLFEITCAAVYQHFPAAKWEIRHLFTALFGLVGVGVIASVFRQGRARWGGLAAAVALLAMPRWYGHMFGNSKDIPFAVGFAIGMLVLIRCFDGKSFTWRRALLLALALGLAFSLRIGAFLLVPFAIGALTLLLLQRGFTRQPLLNTSTLPRRAVQVAAVIAGSWLLMILAWPWALVNPFEGPINAFRMASNFPYGSPVFYGGRYMLAANLPRTYLLNWLSMTVPLPILALAVVGYGIAAVQFVRQWRTPRAIGLSLMLVWIAFPIGYAMVTHPVVYDGMRHFLFILPPLAWFAGHAVATIAGAVPAGKARLAVALAGGLALLTALPAQIRLHPFQYVYFNASVGGVARAQERYETDYWCASYKEAFEWLNAEAANHPEKRLKILVAANPSFAGTARAYAGPQLELYRYWEEETYAIPDFDYYVATTRFRMAEAFPNLQPIHTVSRDGGIFTVIKRGPGLALHGLSSPSTTDPSPASPVAIESITPAPPATP